MLAARSRTLRGRLDRRLATLRRAALGSWLLDWREQAQLSWAERKTLPVETLVRRRLLSMTLKQLELRCTSNTVHFVLNEEHSKDALLNSNEVVQLLRRTPRFIPTPKRVDAADIARDCDIFCYRQKVYSACKESIYRSQQITLEA